MLYFNIHSIIDTFKGVLLIDMFGAGVFWPVLIAYAIILM